MLDSRGGAAASAGAGMHEDDLAGYAPSGNGNGARRSGAAGANPFDKPVDDDIPF
jgi:hypothetical protein